jgi:GntR family transcriptional regulator
MKGSVPSAKFEFRLDLKSGVPVYRQIIDQTQAGIASGRLAGGDQLPTVRQVAVDLAINPNTVLRAYRELEIRGVIETAQGTGTFVSSRKPQQSHAEHERQLNQLTEEFAARCGAAGLALSEVIDRLRELAPETSRSARREGR